MPDCDGLYRRGLTGISHTLEGVAVTQPWLRLHRSAVNNVKLQRHGLEAVGFWVNLLCLTDDTGALRNTVTDIAWQMRIPESNAVTLLDLVIDAGLVTRCEDGSLRMHQWDEHQKRTEQPDYNAEKQRRYRKNKALRNGVTDVLPPRTDTDTDKNRTEGKPPVTKSRKRSRLDELLEPLKQQDEVASNGVS